MSINELVSNNASVANTILSWWNDEVGALFVQGKFEEMVRGHYATDILYSPPDFPPRFGHDDVLDWYETFARPALSDLIEGRATLEIDHTRPQELTVYDDFAIHYEESVLRVVPVSGGANEMSLPRTYLHIFKRVDGAWKLHRYVFNNHAPFQLRGAD